MIIRTDVFQDTCNKILSAVDTSVLSPITETMEICVEDGIMYTRVTNMEYYVEVRTPVEVESNFKVAISANKFLKLISQVTTEVITLSIKDTFLEVKANGTYKFPLVFEGSNMLELPRLNVGVVSTEVDMTKAMLNSIATYNAKELSRSKGNVQNMAQRMFYIDEKGCITHSATGACINFFDLSSPVKILVPQKVVKLFKLFGDDVIKMTVGHENITDEITQVRISFEGESVTIVASLPFEERLVDEVPAEVLRRKSTVDYPYQATFEKNDIISSINRLLVVSNNVATFGSLGELVFSPTELTIRDIKRDNDDKVLYINDAQVTGEYSAILDLEDLKITIEACNEQYVTLFFGDSKAIVISRGNVKNLLPESHIIE